MLVTLQQAAWIAALAFVIAVLGLTAMKSSQQPPQQHEQNRQEPQATNQNAQPLTNENGRQQRDSRADYKEAIKQYWRRLIEFSEQHDKAIVAISTIVIAAFTFALFVATFLLWFAGERHSQRQLRAYVSVDSLEINNMARLFNKQEFEVHITAKNYGQTPAYDLISTGDVVIADPKNPSLNLPKGIRTKSVLGPGATNHKFIYKSALSDGEIAGIKDGSLSLYAFGEFRYKDAFGGNRSTRFRNFIGGTAGYRPTGSMATAEGGNGAD